MLDTQISMKEFFFYSTYVHSYSFHRSTHSNGSGQITFAQGLFDGQLRSKLRAIVACPHCVPFIAGGNGKCFPSNLFNEKRRRYEMSSVRNYRWMTGHKKNGK